MEFLLVNTVKFWEGIPRRRGGPTPLTHTLLVRLFYLAVPELYLLQ